ncbi:MAG: hypothetical protein K6F33_09075 [Bacteroidales bacterium]|nr:hypothetical protein [Bacteroidales bacterium]
MDLYFFNPGCEIEVAAGKAVYSLPKYPAILEHDLSVLPMCMASKGDCVLMSPTKDIDFQEFWSDRFQCEFVSAYSYKLTTRDFHFYRPWGISPRALRVGEKYSFSDEYHRSPVGKWRPCHHQLFSRETSADFFRRLAAEEDYNAEIFPSQDQLPCIANTMDEASKFLYNRPDGAVYKAIFGSSGRGVRILKNAQMTPNLSNWLCSMIKAHGAVECEHLFAKIADFSMHYDIENGRAKWVGVSTFATSDTGAYVGSRVGRLDCVPGFGREVTDRLAELHVKILNNSIYTRDYCGPLGIDCMVYSEGDAQKINPCIEINCRYSMGRLSMQIADLVDAEAYFYVFAHNAAPFDGSSKPVFSNGKLVGGFWPLTPNDTQMFTAGIWCK